MGIEIERRFLVDGRQDKPWREGESVAMFQCYLSQVTHFNGRIEWNGNLLVEEDKAITNISTWRIRLHGDLVTLTAKGKRVNATATEYEWSLSKDLYDSLSLDELPCVRKTRYLWKGGDGLLWEVDEFEGEITGLIIAEVELENEDDAVVVPPWCSLELTSLPGWSNASLSTMIKDSKQN